MFRQLIVRFQRIRWSILTKLLVSFGIILTLLLANSIITIPLQFNLIKLDDQQQQKAQAVNQLQTAERYLDNENSLYTNALFVTDLVVNQFQIKDNFSNEISKLIFQLQNDQAFLSSPNYAQLNEFDSLYQTYLLNLGKVLQVLDERGLAQARLQWADALNAYSAAEAKITNLLASENRLLADLTLQKNNAYSQLTIISELASLVTLLMCIILAFIFSFSIGRPLRQIKLQLDEFAKGNLGGEITVANRDEIGAIATAFNNAIANLRQVISGAQVGEDLVRLSQSLTTNSREQASRTDEQLESINRTLLSVEELSSSARQITNNTAAVVRATEQTNERIHSVQQIAANATEVSTHVEQVAFDTSELVEGTSQAIDELGNRLEELSFNTTQISQVLEIINEVASQVHILALNVAIEAAGAGAYGERFGVVAGEIKELASRTRKATSQVKGLIGLVQVATISSVEQLQIGRAKLETAAQSNYNLGQEVSKLNNVVSETANAVATIVAAAHTVVEQANEIRVATSQQESASSLIFGSLSLLGATSQENAQTSRQLAISTEQLDQLATRLTHTLATVHL